jgi:hypothetical protein
MKLVLFVPTAHPHRNNYEAIHRIYKSHSIEIEESSDTNSLKRDDYNIFLSCSNYVDPSILSPNIKVIFGLQFFVFPSGPIVGDRNEHFSKNFVYNNLSPWIRDVFRIY